MASAYPRESTTPPFDEGDSSAVEDPHSDELGEVDAEEPSVEALRAIEREEQLNWMHHA